MVTFEPIALGEKVVEYSFIGKSIPRVDGQEKVTGEAKFSTDIQLPGMLYGNYSHTH
jgi:CO/xanthine dehydrogenase Mo-binding subunit